MANVPANLKYSNDHEWCRVEGDVAVIGITDYAQSQLGDIVFVDVHAPVLPIAACYIVGLINCQHAPNRPLTAKQIINCVITIRQLGFDALYNILEHGHFSHFSALSPISDFR